MVKRNNLRDKFSTEIKCKKFLYSLSAFDFICGKCQNKNEPYYSKDFTINYIRICKNCKSKISATKNTIFHKVKFTLVKAFFIVIDVYLSGFKITSIEISKRYDITQKTAWLFIKKIKCNKDFVESIFDKRKEKKIKKKDEEIIKLYDYLNN